MKLLGSQIEHSPAPARVAVRPGGWAWRLPAPPAGRPPTVTGRSTPTAFRRLLLRLKETYAAPPIYITENGAMAHDWPSREGAIHDLARKGSSSSSTCMRCLDAMEEGVEVRRLLRVVVHGQLRVEDHGYSHRFGIVHVDFDTQRPHAQGQCSLVLRAWPFQNLSAS